MKDTLIKRDGTSRTLKAPASMPETFEEWRSQLLAGNATMDISLNPDGCTVVGTAMNKANLLSDTTKEALELLQSDPTVNNALLALFERSYAKTETLSPLTKASFSLDSDAVPDDAFALIADALTNLNSAVVKIATGTYTGDGAESRTISLGFKPKAVLVMPNSEYLYIYAHGDYSSYAVQGGLATQEQSATVKGMNNAIVIVDGGFMVYSNIKTNSGDTFRAYTNNSNSVYSYIAIA